CGYTWQERTLGVMPLYHTMGIHALTSMAAIDGCFVCQPSFTAVQALALIARERLTALYLIPTLFWEVVHAPGFATADVASARTPTPGRCATAGTSPATWAGWTPTASSTWPAAWTT